MVVITQVIWTKKFERELRKLRDKTIKDRVKDQIEKVLDNPETGKPLRFALKGERSVYVTPYRLIYAVQGETLYLLRFVGRRSTDSSGNPVSRASCVSRPRHSKDGQKDQVARFKRSSELKE